MAERGGHDPAGRSTDEDAVNWLDVAVYGLFTVTILVLALGRRP